MAATINGSVMNGPTPTMSTMLSAVAGNKVRPRTSCGRSSGACDGFTAIALASHEQSDDGGGHQIGHGAGDHRPESQLCQFISFVGCQRADASDLNADGTEIGESAKREGGDREGARIEGCFLRAQRAVRHKLVDDHPRA